MSVLTEQALANIERIYGPIRANFSITQTPQSAAPEYVREQWVGITLPVREKNLGELATRYLDLLSGEYKDNDEPVSIVGLEAVSALEDSARYGAANYWQDYRGGLFRFRAHEGTFTLLES